MVSPPSPSSSSVHARFACSKLSNPFYVLPSTRTTADGVLPVDFSPSLEAVLAPPLDPADVAAMRTGDAFACQPPEARAVQDWLYAIVGSGRNHAFFGWVPVQISTPVFAPGCIEGANGTRIHRIEFYGGVFSDAYVTHYAAQVRTTRPFQMYSFERVGFAASEFAG